MATLFPISRVHHRVTLIEKLSGTIIYTWVENGTGRRECLAQEHIIQCIMTAGRACTLPVYPNVQYTKH